jgi:hypothetical protein
MTIVQPLSSWVVVTVRPRAPELLDAVANAWPCPPEEDDTLTEDAAPPPRDATCALAWPV